MLYVRVSSKRLFIISKYWILIPVLVAINIALVRKFNKHSATKDSNLEQEYKRWRIFNMAIGNIRTPLDTRGGETIIEKLAHDFIDVTHQNCILPSGVRYVNNNRLRKLVFYHYPEKIKPGIIFITKTALCHLVTEYGLGLPDLPFPIHDFINVSSWGIFLKKAITSFFFTVPISIVGIGGQTMPNYILSALSFLLGFIGMTLTKDFGLITIATETVIGPISLIRRRVKDQPELVYIDLEPNPSSLVSMELP